MELVTRISCVIAPLELGGITVPLGGSISNFKNLGTAAWVELRNKERRDE